MRGIAEGRGVAKSMGKGGAQNVTKCTQEVSTEGGRQRGAVNRSSVLWREGMWEREGLNGDYNLKRIGGGKSSSRVLSGASLDLLKESLLSLIQPST